MSGKQNENIDDLKKEFLEECSQFFAQIDKEIDNLDKDEKKRSESVATLFRVFHTIKGASSFMDLPAVTDFAHSMESVLSLLRNGEIRMDSKMIDFIYKSSEVFKALVFENDDDLSSKESIQNLNKEIDQILKNSSKQPESEYRQKDPLPFPHQKACSILNEIQTKFVKPKLGILLKELDQELESKIKELKKLAEHSEKRELQKILEIWLNIPGYLERNELSLGEGLFEWISESLEVCENLIALDQMDVKPTHEILEDIRFKFSTLVSISRKQKINKLKSSINRETFTLRIPPEKFDQIFFKLKSLESFNEELIDRIKKEEYFSSSAKQKEFHEALEKEQEKIGRLKAELLEVRRIPLLFLFKKFVRIVDYSAKVLNKKIEFNIFGSEIEVDKSLELIHNSLIHLLRNSCDHGIEHPEERKKLGKPEIGNISLSASIQDKHLVLVLEDDGRGINVEKVKQKALEQKLHTREELDSFSNEEIYQLIFKAGFSTAESVSEISGRGVGMDVVIHDLKQLNGTISIHSTPGKGTSTRIVLPLSQIYDQ